MSCPRRTCFVWTGMLLLTGMMTLRAQDPAPPSSTAQEQDSSVKPVKPSKKKYSHTEDFLIRGTVFNERALSFPGVELRFRKEGQKKYRWDTHTNSRGEFAVRVPQGAKYEILVRMKGFVDQARTIDARGGGNEENVVFRMEPIARDKK